MFSEEKQIEVIKFGIDDILQYCSDNIIIKTPETLSDPRYTSAEDIKSKYSRVISGCFYTLSYLIERLPADFINDKLAGPGSILSERSLWEKATYPDIFIRRSFYKLLKTLLERMENFVSENLDSLNRYFFLSSFAEKEPSNHKDFWDAILILLRKNPEIWKLMSGPEKKKFLSNFLELVKFAGYGSCKVTFPCLVLALNFIPESCIEEYGKEKFYIEFLGFFWKSLNQDCIGRKELDIFLKSFWECNMFILKNVPDSRDKVLEKFTWNIFEFFIFTYKFRAYQDKMDLAAMRDICLEVYCKCINSNLPEVKEFAQNFINPFLKSFLETRKIYGEEVVPQAYFADSSRNVSNLLVLICEDSRVDKELSAELFDSNVQSCIDQLDSESGNFELLKGYLSALMIFARHKIGIKMFSGSLGEKLISSFKTALAHSMKSDNRQQISRFISLILDIGHKYTNGAFTLSAWPVLVELFNSSSIDFLLPFYKNLEYGHESLKNPKADEILSHISNKNKMSDDDQDLCFYWLLYPSLFASKQCEEKFFKDIIRRINDSRDLKIKSFSGIPLRLLENISTQFSTQTVEAKGFTELLVGIFELVSIMDGSTIKAVEDNSENLMNIWNNILLVLNQTKMNEFRDKLIDSILMKYQANLSDLCSHWSIRDFSSRVEFFHKSFYGYCGVYNNFERLFGSSEKWVELFEENRIYNQNLVWVHPHVNSRVQESQPAHIKYGRDMISLYGRFILVFLNYIKNHNFHEILEPFWSEHKEGITFRDLLFRMIVLPYCHCRLEKELETRTLICKDIQNSVSDMTESFQGFLINITREYGSSEQFKVALNETKAELSSKYLPLELHWFLSIYMKNVFDPKKTAEELFDEHLAGKNSWGLCDISLFGAIRPSLEEGRTSSSLSIIESLIEDYKDNMQDIPCIFEQESSLGYMSHQDVNIINLVLPGILHVIKQETNSTSEHLDDSRLLPYSRLIVSSLSCLETFLDEQLLLIINAMQNLFDRISDVPLVSRYFILKAYLKLLENHHNINAEKQKIFTENEKKWSSNTISLFLDMRNVELRGISKIAYQNLLSIIVSRLPKFMITRDWPYDSLTALLDLDNTFAQKGAYLLLRHLTLKQAETMSQAIELTSPSELDDEENQPTLPESLTSFIQQISDIQESTFSSLGYLLCWLLILDTIEKSTFRLKSAYAAQLSSMNVIHRLLLFIVDVLDLTSYSSMKLNLKTSHVENFEVDSMDVENPEMTIPILCANILYRCFKSIPSVMRYWYTEQKNRQLVLAIDKYVEQNISPSIIEQEMKDLQSVDQKKIFGDSMKISPSKSSTTSQVEARYNVDDSLIEISIKIPGTYPLKQVEVVGLQRAGVSEERWRRWLLNCNAIMASQNGSILDALIAWKQNVDKHFEGVEECAICYSVIGVMDRSLPNKTCKTCKNTFHAACLRKWFRTSNNSTCPLCRSMFFAA